jgi:anhydro-N-acetylmuramic acid kinase
VFGFDTGPANTLLDNWVKKNKGTNYDRDGLWSRSGVVDSVLCPDTRPREVCLGSPGL